MSFDLGCLDISLIEDCGYLSLGESMAFCDALLGKRAKRIPGPVKFNVDVPEFR